MTQLSALLTDDSRTPLEKLRRSQLQRIATKHGLKFDPTGPATALRNLIEGTGINVMSTDLFERHIVNDENGVPKEVVAPVVKPHATANANIDYDAIIEAKAKAVEKEEENNELRKEMAELRAMIDQLKGKTQETKELKAYGPVIKAKTKPAGDKLNEAYYKDKYEELFGKKPHHLMKPETIKAKVDAKSQ